MDPVTRVLAQLVNLVPGGNKCGSDRPMEWDTRFHWRANLEPFILLSVVFLGFALRIHEITAYSVWLDEASTYFISIGSIPDILRGLRQPYGQAAPPLYHIILHFSLLLGQGELFLRLPSMVFGVLCIPAVYVLGKTFFGKSEGLMGALLLAISPFHVWYSQEARMYTLFLLFAMLSTMFLWDAWQSGRRRSWLCYCVATLLGCYTHFLTFLLIFCQGLFLVSASLVRSLGQVDAEARQRVREGLIGFGMSGVMLLLCYLPWISATLNKMGSSWPFPGPDINFSYAMTILQSFVGRDAACVTLFAFLFACGVGSGVSRRSAPAAFLVLLTLLPPVGVALFLQLVKSFFAARYVIFVLGFFLLIVAWGLSGLSQATRRLARRARVHPTPGSVVVVGAVLAGLLFGESRELRRYFSGQRWSEDWRATAAFVRANAADGDAIAFYQPWVQVPFDYYYDGALEQYQISYALLSGPKTSTDQAFDLALHERLWMVFAYHRIPNSDYDLIRAYLDQHFTPVLDRTFQGNIELVLYEKHDS